MTKQEESEIIRLYKSGLSKKKIGSIFSISQGWVGHILKKYKVPRQYSGNHGNMKPLDVAFFEKIDSPEKAWVLGLLVSDGCIIDHAYYNKIVFVSKDKRLVETFQKHLKSGHKLQTITHDNPRYIKPFKTYQVIINNKKMVSDLGKLGVTSSKSKNGKTPLMDMCYYSHFVRGVFDGDGYVSLKRRSLSICGTSAVLFDIKKALTDFGIKEAPRAIIKQENGSRFDFCKLFYYGGYKVSRVGNFIYQNSLESIRLGRKYDIFVDIWKEYSGTFNPSERTKKGWVTKRKNRSLIRRWE